MHSNYCVGKLNGWKLEMLKMAGAEELEIAIAG
ncbi:hypothetical protein Mucpa_4005 [Mucilaginibacter paludis DSM 18603]|uniref:Uncharacterized protein n=1 Tax=Mucilaginibacter paludis DSM 18603 TaxID=714943 RepID=H1Y4Q2_9SPHI|nr:hypothetical protein Mucpa_4005 [Mucilaginibacter paludis DSM 18603]